MVRGSYRVRRCRRGRRGTTTDDKLRRELITAWQAFQPGDLYRAFTIQGPTGAKPWQACRSGDLVAVLGLGGLGHLGVQLANTLGSETVAIARGADKADTATELGAHHYIDSTAGDVAK